MSASKNAFSFTDVDFTKYMADFRVPGFDADKITETHKKNVEAITQANQIVYETFQTLARRQFDMVRENMETTSEMAKELMNGSAPEQKVAKQADLISKAFERTISNYRELADMYAKSQNETTDIVSKRVVDSFSEIKDLAKKAGK